MENGKLIMEKVKMEWEGWNMDERGKKRRERNENRQKDKEWKKGYNWAGGKKIREVKMGILNKLIHVKLKEKYLECT